MNFVGQGVSYQTQQRLKKQMNEKKAALVEASGGNAKKLTKKKSQDIDYSYHEEMSKVMRFNQKLARHTSKQLLLASTLMSVPESAAYTFLLTDYSDIEEDEEDEEVEEMQSSSFSDISSIFSRRLRGSMALAPTLNFSSVPVLTKKTSRFNLLFKRGKNV